jgi:hypothetical protein
MASCSMTTGRSGWIARKGRTASRNNPPAIACSQPHRTRGSRPKQSGQRATAFAADEKDFW